MSKESIGLNEGFSYVLTTSSTDQKILEKLCIYLSFPLIIDHIENVVITVESCWPKHRSAIATCAFTVFTNIAIIIGVLEIYFTSLKATAPVCGLKFTATTNTKPIEYDYGARSVAVGDFNNDTWLDMVVTNHIVDLISIYFGQDDGSFSIPTQFPTGTGSTLYMVAVGDLSKDSRLDIAVANFGTNSIGVFMGFRNGSFDNHTDHSICTSRPIVISISDLNNDALLVIVSVNYRTHRISIPHGYENGKFSSAIMYWTGYGSFRSSVVIADFNNDNYLDLAVTNYGTDNIDSYVDIAVANFGSNEIGVLVNNGNGTSTKQVPYSTDSASPYTIGVEDFNQDNRLDLLVTNKGANNIVVLIGYGNGTFANPKMYSTGATSPISLAVGDINKDSRLDVIGVSNDTGALDIVFGSFESLENQVICSADSSPYAVAIGLDIVVANYSDALSVFLAHITGDFNNDNQLDIVFSNGGSNDVIVRLGYGSVAIVDVNNGNRLDIIVGNRESNDISIMLQYNRGFLTNGMTYASGGGSDLQHAVVGDIKDDCRLDIVAANYGTNDVGIIFGHVGGTFLSQIIQSAG
ncbi:unnamed protein product [Rotaria socialis]|uniref:Uncharacterized protein n=1 Tax=Rotaria socialis TaxID=392032 RepID=A0A819UPD6_9BILA|nr:unnamed protein product [Rotaria socialis]